MAPIMEQILLNNPPLIFLLKAGVLFILGWTLVTNYRFGGNGGALVSPWVAQPETKEETHVR